MMSQKEKRYKDLVKKNRSDVLEQVEEEISRLCTSVNELPTNLKNFSARVQEVTKTEQKGLVQMEEEFKHWNQWISSLKN